MTIIGQTNLADDWRSLPQAGGLVIDEVNASPVRLGQGTVDQRSEQAPTCGEPVTFHSN